MCFSLKAVVKTLVLRAIRLDIEVHTFSISEFVGFNHGLSVFNLGIGELHIRSLFVGTNFYRTSLYQQMYQQKSLDVGRLQLTSVDFQNCSKL